MKDIIYKIVDGYPIVDYPPALDETFKSGTREIVDGVEVFTPQELQEALGKEQVEQELQAKLQEANQYLKDTDWYYARKADTGEEVPEEVKVKRAEARTFIQENK